VWGKFHVFSRTHTLSPHQTFISTLRFVWACILDTDKCVRPTRCYNYNLSFIDLPLAQHVSGNFMHIFRSAMTVPCSFWFSAPSFTAGLWSGEPRRRLCVRCGGCCSSSTLHTVHSVYTLALRTTARQHLGCRKPKAVKQGLALLKIGKKLPETFWANGISKNYNFFI
jgi:hypothetical protein